MTRLFPKLVGAQNDVLAVDEPPVNLCLYAVKDHAGVSQAPVRSVEIEGQPVSRSEFIRLAADRLHRSGDSVAAIGFSVGYESEAAFSTAFRRVMGRTPIQHRHARSKSERGSTETLS